MSEYLFTNRILLPLLHLSRLKESGAKRSISNAVVNRGSYNAVEILTQRNRKLRSIKIYILLFGSNVYYIRDTFCIDYSTMHKNR